MNAVDYSSGLTGWQQFGQGIANAFNNIFTDDNVNSIVGSLDGMATGIVSALEESLGNEEVQTKIKTVMTSLVDGIAKIIKSDEVQGVLEEAWGVVLDSLETIIREKHPMIDWAYKTYNTEKTYATLGKASVQTLWGKITGSGTGDTTQSPSETIEQRTQSYMTMSQSEIKAQRAAMKQQQEIKKSLETGFYSPFAAGTGFTTKKTTVSTPTTTTGSITSSLPTGTLSIGANISPGTGEKLLKSVQNSIKGKSVTVETSNTDATSTGLTMYNTLQKTASKNAISFKSVNTTKGTDFLSQLQSNIKSANKAVSVASMSNGDGKGYINSLDSDIKAVNGNWKPKVGAKSNGDGKGYINSLDDDIKAVNGDWKPKVGAKSNGDGKGYINTLQADIEDTGWQVRIPAEVTGLADSIKNELESQVAKFSFTNKNGQTITNWGALNLSVEGHANGGYVTEGQMFVAREAGPELVGTIGNRTAVVNNEQIVASVARGVETANAEEAVLLREQNRLLRALLAKDSTVTISTSQIVNGLNRASRRTGTATI